MCEQTEEASIAQLNADETGQDLVVSQPGSSWQAFGHPVRLSHEYEYGGHGQTPDALLSGYPLAPSQMGLIGTEGQHCIRSRKPAVLGDPRDKGEAAS